MACTAGDVLRVRDPHSGGRGRALRGGPRRSKQQQVCAPRVRAETRTSLDKGASHRQLPCCSSEVERRVSARIWRVYVAPRRDERRGNFRPAPQMLQGFVGIHVTHSAIKTRQEAA